MECTVRTADINRVVGMVAPVTKYVPGTPALSRVMLEIRDHTLVARGYDLETEITVSIACGGETNGSITVDSKTFREYIRALRKVDAIKILATAGDKGKKLAPSLVITAETVTHTLPAIPSNEYPPELTKPFGAEIRVLPIQPFAAAMRQVLPATAAETARPALNRVCMSSDGNILRLTAADGFVLMERQLPFSFFKKLQGLLPLKSANHLVKLCADYRDSGNVSFTHQVVQTLKNDKLSEAPVYSFRFEDATTVAEMTGQFAGEDFPEYDKYTAAANPVATFKADEVLEALGQLKAGGSRPVIRLYLDAEGQVLKFTSEGSAGVTSQVVAPAAISEDRHTAINGDYLDMILKASEGQTTIAVANERDPVQFVDSVGLICVVMPIAVNW